MTKSRDELPTTTFDYNERETQCAVKYYGYFNGEFRKCLKDRGLTEQNPGTCKDEIMEKFEICRKIGPS